ncbi:MAG: CapA family protein [Bacteroidales bacterium]|nr:CapA family protein [Bacteroidales bacterium]
MIKTFRKTILPVLLLSCCLKAQAARPDTIRIVFIGDVMSHGPQVTAALRSGGDRNNPGDFDYSSYFKHIRHRLDRADFAVANMEFPVGITPYSGYPQFSAPQSLAYEAQRSGIDLFLTANNHICDKGRSGIDSTYVVYSRLGIPFTGIYRSEGEEYENNPLIVNIKGTDVAFINFTYGTNGLPVPAPWRVNRLDLAHVQEVVARARERQAGLIVALPHWGEEYHLEPNQEQRLWAKTLLEMGVDAVIGGHPHVVQPTRFEQNQAVAYSLGNYISNQSDTFTQIEMLYELVVVNDGTGKARIVEAFPTYLWCSRRGGLEKNYTVIPILEWLGRRDQWLDPGDYDKMAREWEAIKKKFDL